MVLWGLGIQHKEGKAGKKLQGLSSPTHMLNTSLWLLTHGYPSSIGGDVGLGKSINL